MLKSFSKLMGAEPEASSCVVNGYYCKNHISCSLDSLYGKFEKCVDSDGYQMYTNNLIGCCY